MSATIKKDTEVHITYDDQQMINAFARENNKYVEITDDIKEQEKCIENLNEALEEIEMMVDEQIPIKIGEVFIYSTSDEAVELMQGIKVDEEIKNDQFKKKAEDHKKILSDLKISLYAKFGDTINLESD